MIVIFEDAARPALFAATTAKELNAKTTTIEKMNLIFDFWLFIIYTPRFISD